MKFAIWTLNRNRDPDAHYGEFYQDRKIRSTLDRCGDYGIVWIMRGLWCGVVARYAGDPKPWFFCSASLEDVDVYNQTPLSSTEAHLVRQWLLHEPAVVVAQKFPYAPLAIKLHNQDPAAVGADGVPFCIHKINDRNARRIAIANFKATV